MYRDKVDSVLNSIPKTKKFGTEVELILYVAESTGVHRTTLKRNPEYYRRILNFLGTQPGATGSLSIDEADNALLKAKLMTAEAEIALKDKEIHRLKLALERLSKPLLNSKTTSHELYGKDAFVSTVDRATGGKLEEVALGSTFIALSLVLEWVINRELGLSVNLRKEQIEDETTYGADRVLVPKNRAKHYIEFIKKHPEYARWGRAPDAKYKDRI